ncbi:MAG: hypothetical protein GXY44_10710 [Phycisphaerales bacterium]|nr:hypothetical protein [Phycisphaerales bacterium]
MAHPQLGGSRWQAPYPWVWLAMLTAVSLAVLAYYPLERDQQFVYDDLPIIVENPLITAPGPWYRFWLNPYWPRHLSRDLLYRPLVMASFRLNTLFSEDGVPNAISFYRANILLHALTAAGVVVLGYRLTGRASAGLLAGTLFAVHPVNAEAVATACGRCEVLAGLFGVWLLALQVIPTGSENARSTWSYVLGPLLFLGAIMSKEHAILLWPVIFIMDLGYRRLTPMEQRLPLRQWFNRYLAPRHAGYALACMVFFVLRFAVFGQYLLPAQTSFRIWEHPMGYVGLLEHVLTPFRLLALIGQLFVQPSRLCPIWSVPALAPADHLSADVLAGMVLAVALLGLTGWLWWRRSLVGALLAGLLILLLIPTHALPLAKWIFAERWLYLPGILVATLAGTGLNRCKGLGLLMGLACLGLLLPATWSYAAKFRDNRTLFEEVVLRQPESYKGRCYVAYLNHQEQRHAEAVHEAREIIARFGPTDDAYEILFRSYLELGDGHQALQAMQVFEKLKEPFPVFWLADYKARARQMIAGPQTQLAEPPSPGEDAEQ